MTKIKNSKDSLGDRLKNHESRNQTYLSRRQYCVIRLDGRSFHQYCAKLAKPFDDKFISDMDATMCFVASELQGCFIGYCQSDEITFVLQDFKDITTDAFFDYNVQKITSISASLATAFLNSQRPGDRLATFDSRCFSLADPYEVENALIWRQKDAERNSIQMLARSLYSHKELNAKKIPDLHDMLHNKGVNWNDLDARKKRGRVAVYEKGKGWTSQAAPIFVKQRSFMRDIIPLIPNWKLENK